MFKVKICGITNLDDALHAIKCGADALGFVFYEKSPRYISAKEALKIVEKLPPFVEKVGLFVNASFNEINTTCKEAKMSLAQIHFGAKPEVYKNLELPHIKVVRATCKEDLSNYSDEYRLVDAYVKNFGGAGKRINKEWFESIDCSKIILAGGLSCNNIEEMKKYNFYGFDVSSSLESSKGKKDGKKVEDFIQKAKS